MSLTLKRIFMAVFGLLGALALWPCLLTLQFLQPRFPGYLVFTLAQGMVLGLVFGAFFGSFEGVVVSSRPKAFKGFAFGAVFGALAGAVGVLGGQFFLFAAGSIMWRSASARNSVGLAVAGGLAWTIVGLFLALIEGVRARSSRKLLVGLAGGAIGGLAGGTALSALSYFYPDEPLSLLAGLLLFGLLLGGFYSLFENRFSSGALMLLNGPLKGKEYYILSKKMRIGSAADCDIVLKGYPEVEVLHATVYLRDGKVFIEQEKPSARLLLNDEPPAGRSLRPEDVLAVGKAKFIYGYFS
ncbi:MAG: forkhead-associated protein [Spirochaetales bacterium]|nr:MAG: forkhead-associated protein [Spirochaetales bacterium]